MTRSEALNHASPPSAPALSLLVDYLAHGLERELAINRTKPSTQVEKEESADHLLAIIRHHRLQGFFLRHSDHLSLPGEVGATLQSELHENAMESLAAQARAARVSKLFSEAGVTHLIYKGWPLVVLTESESEFRGTGDVDILVSPEDAKPGHALLISHGSQPVYAIGPQTRLGWQFVLFRNKEMPYRSDIAEVDLHWRVATEHRMMPKAGELLKKAVSVQAANRTIPTLCPVDALAATAFHFYLDYCQSPRRLVDFLRLHKRVNCQELSELPEASRQIIADTLALCRKLFGLALTIPAELPTPSRENIQEMEQMFWGADMEQANQAESHPFTRNCRHLRRYAPGPYLVARLLARGLVWFPPTAEHPRPIGVLRAFWWQVGRVLRGKTDSHI